MAVVDYSSNFWGDKHIGYSVLYENMKKGEESVHELLTFLKERVNMEDDLFKSLGKSLHRVNGYISNNSGFVDAWKLAKETLELWTEIQSSTLRNLNDLLKEVARYQEELARMRKRAKDADTLETINLMQTTTTCLQKARDTFNQRSTEVVSLKQSNKEWTAASTKEYLRARNKLNKAHEEYKQYMDKYSQIRDTFEERVSQAARSFQEHDRLHLLQMKSFFTQMAKCLENAHGANAQVSATLRQRVEQNINVEQMMFRFIEEKGTGTEPPQKLQWTNADELPPELDVVSCVQSQSSSSNSSAIVPNFSGNQLQSNANHLLCLNDSWLTVGGGKSIAAGGGESANSGGSIDGGFGESTCSLGVKRGSINGCSEQNKSAGESDSERHLELPFSANPSSSVLSNFSAQNPSSSYVPQQISSWLGRQKFSGRLKKHFSTSQSNLAGPMAIEPFAVGEGDQQTKNELIGSASNFSKSCNDPSTKTNSNSSAGLLKRYQKGKGLKRSMGDLTAIGKSQSELAPISSLDQTDKELQKVLDPLEVFGPPPPLPSTEPPPLNDELVSAFNRFSADHVGTSSTTKAKEQQPILQSVSFVSTASGGTLGDGRPNRRSASSSSSTTSDEEDICLAAQRSKIRQMQIRPLNDSQQPKLNASVDELRTAIGQLSLPKCKGSESDPWGGGPTQSVTTQLPSGFFSNSHQEGPIRAALTGDEHLRRKYHELPLSDFSQSVASLSGATIARARPRSHTPLVPNPLGTPASFSPFVGSEPKEEAKFK
ncbi:hypothetical protein niasHS_003424 [Heterodera schachtii]|uniref:F-BAR domain-containing protein n=1 Tax=Heterodera schachtii TaxID=97005 RepID=A0ABD2KGG1_HETSC